MTRSVARGLSATAELLVMAR